jgi:VWFA-related protein
MKFAWVLLALTPLLAQEDLPVFRAETTLALLRFHVVQKNRYVDGLKADDVVLLEDGAPRKITLFEGGLAAKRTVPVELALVFDISGSVTQEGLLDPLVYKSALLDGLDNVRLAVYGFDSNLKRFCRPTRDFNELSSCFNRVLNFKSGSQPRPDVIKTELPPKRKNNPRGGTWLFESVLAAARDMAAGPSDVTRMMLVFSDGFPTTNTRVEDVAPALREIGIPVFPVALGHGKLMEQAKHIRESGYNRQGVLNDGARDRLQNIQMREQEIQEFADLGEFTGGRSFDPPLINLLMMRTILTAMVGAVRCEFVVGFAPEASPGQPKKHKLEVKLRSKEIGKVTGGTRTVVH